MRLFFSYVARNPSAIAYEFLSRMAWELISIRTCIPHMAGIAPICAMQELAC